MSGVKKSQVAESLPYTGELPADITQDAIDLNKRRHIAGWTCVPADETVIVPENKIALASKYEEQDGYIEHDGFIDGCE